MTLFDLRKKIEGGLIQNPQDEWNKGRNEVIRAHLHYLNEEIALVESRVSQLEKEIHERYVKEGPQNWEKELLINKELDTLRGVLGK